MSCDDCDSLVDLKRVNDNVVLLVLPDVVVRLLVVEGPLILVVLCRKSATDVDDEEEGKDRDQTPLDSDNRKRTSSLLDLGQQLLPDQAAPVEKAADRRTVVRTVNNNINCKQQQQKRPPEVLFNCIYACDLLFVVVV